MYLLDTNVVSELRKNRPHGAVLAWLHDVKDSDLHLSAVTLGEIQVGIEQMRQQDTSKAAAIEAWADLVASTYNVLPIDAVTFRLWAKLMRGKSQTVYEDALIAASALAHNRNFTVVTRNVRDFACFPVKLFNPFSNEPSRADG